MFNVDSRLNKSQEPGKTYSSTTNYQPKLQGSNNHSGFWIIWIIGFVIIAVILYALTHQKRSLNAQQAQNDNIERTNKDTIPEKKVEKTMTTEEKVIDILTKSEITESYDWKVQGVTTIGKIDISLTIQKDGSFTYYLGETNDINPNQNDAVRAKGNYKVMSGDLTTGVNIHFTGKTDDGRTFDLLGELKKSGMGYDFFYKQFFIPRGNSSSKEFQIARSNNLRLMKPILWILKNLNFCQIEYKPTTLENENILYSYFSSADIDNSL